MAAVGATIVVSGLAILATIISQLHKVLAILEKKETAEVEIPPVEEEYIQAEVADPLNIDTLVQTYQPLIDELEAEFELCELYFLAHKYHLPHPHLSINRLRDAERLQSVGDGVFSLT